MGNGNEKQVYTWMNEPEEKSGSLRQRLDILARAGSDFIVDPEDGSCVASAPFLFQNAPSVDFTITSKLMCDFHETYDSAVLMLFQDQTHWMKVCYERTFSGTPAVVSVRTDDWSDDCNGPEVPATGIWLRMSVRKQAIGAYYSLDGRNWSMHRVGHLWKSVQRNSLKVGVVAQCPLGSGCRSCFSDYSITSQSVDDLRIGELKADDITSQ